MSRFAPAGPLRGSLTPPPDKSISHRAAIVAAMGEGDTPIAGYLDSADTRSTLAAVAALGAEVTETGASARAPGGIDLTIGGIGLAGPGERAGEEALALDVGNAGTLMRLLPGWLASQHGGSWTLDGDESIRRRPVDRVADPLRLMGARIECREDRFAPLEIRGRRLIGIDYRLPVASAQVKSCLLLAGLRADGRTEVTEPAPSRDHTERMLVAAGVRVRSERHGTGVAVGGELPGRVITVSPVESIGPPPMSVPGDFSSAAFHLVAALIVPRSQVRLEGVGLNDTRVGLLGILNRMGAGLDVVEDIPVAGESRGTVVARSGPLGPTRVAAGEVPLAIDELPLVALAAAFAEGRTVVSGAGELRHKESDRIASVVGAIKAMGGDAEATEDGFAVRGTGGLRGGVVDPRGDHRLSMLAAVAGLASREGVEVDMGPAAVSYPGFEADLRSLTP